MIFFIHDQREKKSSSFHFYFLPEFFALCLILFSFSFFSCATTAQKYELLDSSIEDTELRVSFVESTEKSKICQKDFSSIIKIIKHPERMFWEVKCNGASVFVLGTIHLGRQELFPLEKGVLSAIEKSERFFGEVAETDFEMLGTKIQKKLQTEYIKDLENSWIKELSKTEIESLQEIFGSELLEFYSRYEPWVCSSELQKLIAQKMNIASTHGVDFEVMQILAEKNKTFEGLEDVEVQINLMAFGTREEQLENLKALLLILQSEKCLQEEKAYSEEIYWAYFNDDEEKLASLVGIPEKNLQKESYHSLLFYERNKRWAKHILNLLKMKGNSFIFAGAGHFVGKDSVFSFLQN